VRSAISALVPSSSVTASRWRVRQPGLGQQVRFAGIPGQHDHALLAAGFDEVVRPVRFDHHHLLAARCEALGQQPALATQPADDHVVAPEAHQ
jgi:hypothetical protein